MAQPTPIFVDLEVHIDSIAFVISKACEGHDNGEDAVAERLHASTGCSRVVYVFRTVANPEFSSRVSPDV